VTTFGSSGILSYGISLCMVASLPRCAAAERVRRWRATHGEVPADETELEWSPDAGRGSGSESHEETAGGETGMEKDEETDLGGPGPERRTGAARGRSGRESRAERAARIRWFRRFLLVFCPVVGAIAAILLIAGRSCQSIPHHPSSTSGCSARRTWPPVPRLPSA
jgi:hypothetical protein